ncbi:hypothetical protein EHS25_008629 [Saitozyma podzolica]|uniref:HECT-type E3 ubiquitin transferase n=1 Tax=Saitozyma podzolica TaxID=1890683 RepID=A0A427YM74_9TREE|nr:hypothetical protein EHS25_008629 [Saitozyma podzolica]
MFGGNFGGPGRLNRVDLSTSTSTSSYDLLSSVRAERQAREERKRQDQSAQVIQRVWRGFAARKRCRDEVLARLEAGKFDGLERRGRALVGVARLGVAWEEESGKRMAVLLETWTREAGEVNQATGMKRFVQPVLGSSDWGTILGLLSIRVLQLVAHDPKTTQATALLDFLEKVLDPKNWAGVAPAKGITKRDLVEALALGAWIELLVGAMESLAAASLPKQKHPTLQPITRLLTAPFSIVTPSPDSPFISPMIHTLLAVPSLPSILPLPSLTHLSTHLPLFNLLLPFAASHTEVLSSGRLRDEVGRSHLLANLATFGITGNMLARYGATGASTWVRVIGAVLRQVDQGWGRWAEGFVDEDQEDVRMVDDRSDDEDDQSPGAATLGTSVVPTTSRPRRQVRPALPKNLGAKLLLIASPSHLATLSTFLTSPTSKAPTSLLVDFAQFALALLNAFRGSPKWEGILDGLLEGPRGRALGRRLWREGVRGRWRNSGDKSGWDSFFNNPSTPTLLFMTHLYNHYLLLTPDDEFFSASNPLSLDEVQELAGIWKDLAFWGYMNGVAAVGSSSGMGTEEERNLFTRGVTRVAERNARRQFTPEDFWVMSNQMDLQGFVEAAVFEDAELSLPDAEDEDSEMMNPGDLPRYARTRQRWTKRQMAYISPRLGLLNNLPMAVPFQTRLQVFRQFVETDRRRLGLERYSTRRRYRHQATIHRTSLAEDGFRQLNGLGPALKGTIEISFIDKWGQEESGIDGGGLFKEFLTNLSKEAFDTNRGLWLSTDQNELYPNPHSYATEAHQLSWYGFIGRVLGKALYEGILVDVSFAGFFLAKWLGRQSYLDDLNSLDNELYKGLIILKNYAKPEELALNFTVTEEEFGLAKSIDLVPGGSEIGVTAENRHEYIQLVCKYKLDKQIAQQSRAFFNGLSDIIDPKWLRMFDQHELQQLIGGEETLIDIDDLRAHAVVSGFPNDNTIRLFWKVVKGFNQEQRRALLRFVTSCSRPPLLGFEYLNPNFGIRFGGGDDTRLPSASSCANLLKLPGYNDEYTLRSKLLQAITSGAGFDLS